MFNADLFTATPRHRAVYNFYEVLYTTVDFVAAAMFVVGSASFFYAALQTAGTWLFLIGSLFFAARPTVRLLREFHLSRLPVPGDPDPREQAGG